MLSVTRVPWKYRAFLHRKCWSTRLVRWPSASKHAFKQLAVVGQGNRPFTSFLLLSWCYQRPLKTCGSLSQPDVGSNLTLLEIPNGAGEAGTVLTWPSCAAWGGYGDKWRRLTSPGSTALILNAAIPVLSVHWDHFPSNVISAFWIDLSRRCAQSQTQWRKLSMWLSNAGHGVGPGLWRWQRGWDGLVPVSLGVQGSRWDFKRGLRGNWRRSCVNEFYCSLNQASLRKTETFI